MQHLFPPWCPAGEVVLPCRPGREVQYQFPMTSEIENLVPFFYITIFWYVLK